MSNVNLYDEKNAKSQDIKDRLLEVKNKYGFIPNILAIAAESKVALNTYLTGVSLIDASTLTAKEAQLSFLAISFENNCDYCVAAHSTIAQMLQVDLATIESLRNGEDLKDTKLNQLISFTRELFQTRGFVDKERVDQFLQAGYSRENIYDLITIIATKTISNYINHIENTPLDDAFLSQKWEKR
ncbi:carboxymuconolactone decarboxylase family protein [bacterium]|nr:carboxymuconolactone decarboxylase family protein [bacterium]